VEEEEEDEEDDRDEDEGKEPWTLGRGEMVNTSPDDVDTMVDDETIVLPNHGQERHKHTPPPQAPVATPQPQTLDPRP
jgi:hypothetical protein